MSQPKMINIGGKIVGGTNPCYLIGEIGINHNGDIGIAMKLADYCGVFGFDCVKLQKREPEICVPPQQRDQVRATPWGEMTYLEYRKRIEFGESEYGLLKDYATQKNLHFTASAWDIPSLEFLLKLDVPFIKIPSAMLVNQELLAAAAESPKPLMISSGMSTLAELDDAVDLCLSRSDEVIILHCHSAYPAPIDELNLSMIPKLAERYPECVIGYSGHEFGLDTTMVATVLGAKVVERHITIDRTMWGSDQMASVEPQGMYRLSRDIRLIRSALGDGIKVVNRSELPARQRLRG